MKSKILFILFFLSLNCGAQNYILDNTFGENGIKKNRVSPTFTPINGQLINNYYYLISTNKIAKIDYNGTLVTNYGSYGFISLENSNKIYVINNFKFLNGFFYIYGKVTTRSNEDIFIYKIDENGIADNTFGTNGMVTIDFTNNETISDFIFEPNGSLLCIGNQKFANSEDSRLIHFKLNSNGAINYTYDTNGFKFFSLNLPNILDQTTGANGIYPFNGKYLLVGSHSGRIRENNVTRIDRILLTVIDNNGNTDLNYGDSGYRRIAFETDGGTTSRYIENVQLIDNNLYIKYFYQWSFNNQGSKILRYNLDTNQTVFNIETMYNTYIQAESDGFFTSGTERCYPGPCLNFQLNKFHVDGTLDTSFSNNGTYKFIFPNSLSHILLMHIKDSNGKILMPGVVDGDFSMIRIKEGTLSVDKFIQNNVSISPNPFYNKINIITDRNIKSIEIIDLAGRKIDEPEFTQIDNSTYSLLPKTTDSGISLIKITFIDNMVTIKKIIKN